MDDDMRKRVYFLPFAVLCVMSVASYAIWQDVSKAMMFAFWASLVNYVKEW